MKFATSSEHRDFFRKNGRIEFEALCSQQDLKAAQTALPKVICQRLNAPEQKFEYISAGEQFSAGRDLWRDEPRIKKIVLNRAFAQIASELTSQTPLRIGFDQYLPIKTGHASLAHPYTELLKNHYTAADFSPLQGVAAALILCLIPPALEEKNPFFPSLAGDGVFVRPDYPIPFPEMAKLHGASYLFIIYGSGTTVYCVKAQDPLHPFLRKVGYDYGDKLNDQKNPILSQ